MDNQSNVWFVDAHTKSICCRDNPKIANPERLQCFPLFLGTEPCMITLSCETLLLKELCYPFRRTACCTVDNTKRHYY